jgi:hypothetical protein
MAHLNTTVQERVLDPCNRQVHYDLAPAMEKRGDFRQALYRRVITLAPERGPGTCVRARLVVLGADLTMEPVANRP